MSEDTFLKAMLFASPVKTALMKRPLLAYAMLGYTFGFWGYISYRMVKDQIQTER